MIKKSKLLMLTICLVIGMFSAVVVEAATYGYLTKETVTKNGPGTVHSNSTGTNSFAFNYGASCWSKSMTVEVQHYLDGEYFPIVPIRKVISADSSFSDSGQYTGFKMFRIQLSGSGTGSGWIQGRS
ncbi:MAG: hypothetical protein HDR00_15565 [Lachnospiraceae bacterium]|nr:hypothetical protein [Lachnospiraceae bacterium]